MENSGNFCKFAKMFTELLKYRQGDGVEAFSTQRDAVLPYPVIQGHQVHDSQVAVIDRPDYTREELEGYDAFVTALPGVAIGVRTADCVPILLYDPAKRVVAAVHSGWKSTVLHIAQKAINVMAQQFGCKAEDISAVIGPHPSVRTAFRWAKRLQNISRMQGSRWIVSGPSVAPAMGHRCPAGIISTYGKRTGGC